MKPTDKDFEKYKETNLFMGTSFKFKVFEVIHRQDSILKLHWHEYIEMLYIAEGHPVINIGSGSYQASPGDILFVNRRQRHSGCKTDNSQVKYYAIVFDPSLFAGNEKDPDYRQFIMPFISGTRLFPVVPKKDCAYYSKIKNCLNMIIEEYQEAQPGFEIKIKALLYSLIIEVVRNDLPIDLPAGNSEKKQETKSVKDLISYIYLTCPRKMTIKEAARYVQLSPYYFCKVFKKVTGWTFIEFLNIYKITKAEEFLMHTDDSITDIAHELGFCNTNYFDKVFKQLKGYSPSELRKQTKMRLGG